MFRRGCAVLCLLLALGFFPRPAQAIFMTGKDLMRNCMGESQKEIYDCMGYVAGVIDYHVMMQSLGTAPTIDFCLPESVTISQATVMVMNYLSKAPQNADFIAAPTVTLALHEAWPCAKPGRKSKRKK